MDRIKPGFFIRIADTVGDSFFYWIIPGKAFKDIPKRHVRPIVCSIVQLRDLANDHSPVLTERLDGSYDICNKYGVSLPNSDLSGMELLDYESPSVQECIDYADPALDLHTHVVDDSSL